MVISEFRRAGGLAGQDIAQLRFNEGQLATRRNGRLRKASSETRVIGGVPTCEQGLPLALVLCPLELVYDRWRLMKLEERIEKLTQKVKGLEVNGLEDLCERWG